VSGLQGLLRAGSRVPAASLGLCRDLLSPGLSGEDRLRVAALRMFRESAGLLGELFPGEGQTGWRELENKLEAFEWFTVAGPLLGLADGARPQALAEQLRRVSALEDDYTALWALEGLGRAYARAEEALPPRELLSEGRLAGLPAGVVVPLHTGSALVFAERLLASLDRREAGDRDLVWRWLDICQDGFQPGYAALAVEALGLVARNLQPCRLGRLDEILAAVDPVLTEYLWHGVGRGLYFAPTHLLPWSLACRRAFAKAWTEPPHEAGRRNAVAGLAWALALVNVRSPEVVEAALASWDGRPGAGEAIANGTSSALLVWRHWAGWDAWLARFLNHHPTRRDRQWRLRVLDPCRAALASSSPDLGRRDQLAALFRFQVPS
jgi:hypothetical protein